MYFWVYGIWQAQHSRAKVPAWTSPARKLSEMHLASNNLTFTRMLPHLIREGFTRAADTTNLIM